MTQFHQQLLVILTIILGFGSSSATADDVLIVSPISAMPSNQIHNGMLVWVDLVTIDPRKAVQF